MSERRPQGLSTTVTSQLAQGWQQVKDQVPTTLWEQFADYGRWAIRFLAIVLSTGFILASLSSMLKPKSLRGGKSMKVNFWSDFSFSAGAATAVMLALSLNKLYRRYLQPQVSAFFGQPD